jgi:hypothetical protein
VRSEPADRTLSAATGAALALTGLPDPEPDAELDRFWLPPPPLPPRPPVLAVEPDLVLRQLPTPAPRLGGGALTERLRSAYARFGSDL